MTYADLLPLYYPPVSYDVRATQQAAERQAEAAIFDGVQAQSAQVLAAAYAPTAGGDITRWERLLGINPPQPDNYARRVADVLAKLNETGGLYSWGYLYELASGYATM